MTEVATKSSMAPALHLVAMEQHLRRGSLYDSQDDGNGSTYVVGEENMTCLTNSADSAGCQWLPVGGNQWMKRPLEMLPDNIARSNDYGLQELYCAVAQQHDVSSQNDQKSDWSESSKSGDPNDSFLNSDACKSYLDDERTETRADKFGGGADNDESFGAVKRRSSKVGRCKNDYDQHSPGCNHGNRKPQLERLGWKVVGRHAENRRKRWAQADPLLDFWKGVSASRYAAPFRRPVAFMEEYDAIIRQPMDLSTIRRQLENNESYSLESLRRDLMLMVTNAMVYNKKGSETYDMALKLKNHAIRLFEGHIKEASYPNPKLSPVTNSSKTVAKPIKAKPTLQATDRPTESEGLPLAPIKKHRTMRRPRSCISSEVNGLRSDVANGSAVDSSSEEEAAAVLICFSSGKSGDEKQSLSAYKAAKSESPRKRIKTVEIDTDNTSACSVTQLEGLSSRSEQCVDHLDISPKVAVPSWTASISNVDTRSVSWIPEKYKDVENSQAKEFESPGLCHNIQAPMRNLASASGVEGRNSSGRGERTCRGLKHKWQERWRMQSAVSSENIGSLDKLTEPVGSQPCDKYALEGVSAGETSYRPFAQVLQT